MVGNGIGAYFGNAFSTLKPSDDPDGTKVGWFLTAMSDVTMINDDDYRYFLTKNCWITITHEVNFAKN